MTIWRNRSIKISRFSFQSSIECKILLRKFNMKSKSGYFEIYLLKITNAEMISIICCETVSTKNQLL